MNPKVNKTRIGPWYGRAALCAAAVLLAGCLPLTAQQQSDGLPPGQPIGQGYSSSIPAPSVPVPSRMASDLVTPEAPGTYVIGPEDLLSIFVYQMPELTRQVRVGLGGHIRLPFLNNSFLASGKTARQLAHAIRHALVRQELANSPIVQVIVRQVMSKPIIINGAVRMPLTLQAARPLSLLEAISRAGGITAEAGNIALVSLPRASGAPGYRKINLPRLMNGDTAENIFLLGNDTVTILPAKLVYAVGDFHRPGAFPLRTNQPVTVLNAVALAQGFADYSNQGKAVIIHTFSNGRQTITPVNISKVLHHKIPDPQLQGGDILYVPKNHTKVILVDALKDAASAVVLGSGYGLSNGKF